MDTRIAHTQRIIRGSVLLKNQEVLVTCNQSAKKLAGDEWNLGDISRVYTEDFWTWTKTDTIGYDVHPYLDIDKCVDFER